MTKNEFLEILKDYLKKDFSEDDLNDILRDYEEYFIDGTIEGKSDIEIIQSLGSPKMIANELISQAKSESKSEYKNNKDKMVDKYNLFKLRTKENLNKTKDIISEKLTLDIKSENHEKSRKAIKLILSILSLVLIIPAFIIGTMLLSIGVALIATLALFLGTIPFMYNFLKATPDVFGLYVSLSVAFVGGQILSWQLYSFILGTCRKLIKKYTNWLKTRNLYINASEKKEEFEKEQINYYEGRDEENE